MYERSDQEEDSYFFTALYISYFLFFIISNNTVQTPILLIRLRSFQITQTISQTTHNVQNLPVLGYSMLFSPGMMNSVWETSAATPQKHTVSENKNIGDKNSKQTTIS